MSDVKREDVISRVSPARREFMRKVAKAGFVAPAVATFTMSGLMSRPAAAQASNQS